MFHKHLIQKQSVGMKVSQTIDAETESVRMKVSQRLDAETE
jgi:hypothetical protein